jgi:hypothetical protein
LMWSPELEMFWSNDTNETYTSVKWTFTANETSAEIKPNRKNRD